MTRRPTLDNLFHMSVSFTPVPMRLTGFFYFAACPKTLKIAHNYRI